jgi:putative membrane protein
MPDQDPDQTRDGGPDAPGGGPPRDPDARFLLANERTLLAWVRTSLALLASGVGLMQFLPDIPLNSIVGVGMLVLGALASLVGLQRYRAADTAMRNNVLPPRGPALEVVTLALFVLGAVLIVLLVTHRATTI